MQRFFSAEEDAVIRELHGSRSSRFIVNALRERLGVERTASSVISRAGKLGLSVKRDELECRGSRQPLNARGADSSPRAEPESASLRSFQSLLARWPKPKTATAIKFLAMPQFDRCRMPLWGDDEPISSRYYCGAPTEGGATYCPECRAATVSNGNRRAA